ncbi:SDR family oxidoreductase [Pseudonocardia xinjiangensis]|uniref:SDR family oxidoreductase n=1 Tax=Pseudonocardia xinjiangensis TaxID=75289 RepID=UPI003D933FF0
MVELGGLHSTERSATTLRAGGIGRAVAEKLAADGFAVVVHYAGNEKRAAETVNTITAAGGAALAVRADVADGDEVAALFDRAEQRFGGIDVVVHTAGIMYLVPLAEADLTKVDHLLRTNVRGTLVVAQQAARRIRTGGAITMFSSTVVRLAQPTYAIYAASKGAADAMTLVLARELRGRNITVNTVAPGPTATSLFLDGKDEATIQHLAALPPLERLGTPEDIANTVSFLSGPEGRWINGQVLAANGGIA